MPGTDWHRLAPDKHPKKHAAAQLVVLARQLRTRAHGLVLAVSLVE